MTAPFAAATAAASIKGPSIVVLDDPILVTGLVSVRENLGVTTAKWSCMHDAASFFSATP